MKGKIGKILIAMATIVTMTIGNVLVIGQGLISNAESESKTSHKNVQMRSYFKTKEGIETKEIEEQVGKIESKLIMEVKVENEGYMNGKIKLEESNFQIKGAKENEKIKEIKENEISLNTIKAGEKVEIEVEIEEKRPEEIEKAYLEKASKIKLEGIYKDQTEKDIEIKGEQEVKLKLANPYEEGKGNILGGEILTNKKYKIGEETKRIVQIKIISGLEGNSYPIKENEIKIEGLEEAEETKIEITKTKATNGLEGNEATKRKYEAETIKGQGTTIKITNEDENGNKTWNKQGEDEIIATYIIGETSQVEGKEIKITNNIKLADEKTNKQAETKIKIEGEKEGTVTYKIEGQEEKIYKGKIYSKEERKYKTNKTIQINYAKINPKIETIEEVAKYKNQKGEEIEAESKYKETKINKKQIEEILGEEGSLTIKDQNGKEITKITKETKANEKGEIQIKYEEGTKGITIEIEKAEKEGEIKLEHTKAIQENKEKEESKNYTTLKETIKGTNKEEAIKETKLEEPKTQAKLEIGKSTLTTVEENKDVELKATLETKGEDKNLYKNAKIKITMPEEIEKIEIKNIKLIYEKELKIKEIKQYKENGKETIEIQTEGEQTKYKEEAIEGAEIRINTNIKLNQKAGTSQKEITMKYENEKGEKTEGENKSQIQIEAPKGIITINKIDSLGIKSLREEKAKTAKLEIGKEAKETEIGIEIKNNNEEAIEKVEIIGRFPTKAEGSQNNIETEIKEGIKLGGKQAKVSYSTDANPSQTSNWQNKIENGKEVKSYKIEVERLEVGEEIIGAYKVKIPEKLNYNAQAYEGYAVNYTNSETKQQEQAKATTIGMATGTGPEIKQENMKMTAKVGGEEVTNNGEVKQGEIIRYEIEVKNTGTEEAKNVKVTAPVPEGTVFMKIEPKPVSYEIRVQTYYEEVPEQKQISYTIEKMAPNETKILSYEVRVKNAQEGANITSKAIIEYSGIKQETNEIVNPVKQANLQLTVQPIDILEGSDFNLYKENKNKVNVGTTYVYTITVKNISNEEIKNVKLELDTSKHYDDGGIDYETIPVMNDYKVNVKEVDKKTCIIDAIPANKETYIPVYSLIQNLENNKKSYMTVNAVLNNNKFHSNYYQEEVILDKIQIEQLSPNKNQFVKPGETIEYTVKVKNIGEESTAALSFENYKSEYITLIDVRKNGILLKPYGDEETADNNYYYNDMNNKIKHYIGTLAAKEETEYKIRVEVNSEIWNTEVLKIINAVEVQRAGMKIAESKDMIHLLGPNSEVDGDGNNNGQGGSNDGSNNINTNNQIISGTAWLDNNGNGKRDEKEPLLPQVKVRLLNAQTNKLEKISVITDENGFYTLLNVPDGKYLVVFEYDSNRYMLTTYQREGVADTENSDAIPDSININGKKKQVGITDTIEVSGKNIASIDIGLREAKTFDLKLDKYVNKIVVQNSKGTNTYKFNNETLAKVEIDGKQINNTNVVVEYKIKLTNIGEIPGFVKEITDYLPSDMKFSSELNKGWYQEKEYINNKELASKVLKAGESKEITLILTKKMTETNTGLVHNTAEILDQYNELGAIDNNSIPGNQAEGENDMGSADVIIGIKTGAMVSYIVLTISIIGILGTVAYVISKKIMKDKI